jgi:hypothetical protein
MLLNTAILLTRATNSIYLNYDLYNAPLDRSFCVNDLGILFDCLLHFHSCVDYM